MAGQANDPEKLPWLEPYRDPVASPRRPPKPPKLKAVDPLDPPSEPAVQPQAAKRGAGVPLAAWLATGVVVVAMAAGGGYWAGNRNTPEVAAAAPSVTIPVAAVEPIPMPDVEVPEAPNVAEPLAASPVARPKAKAARTSAASRRTFTPRRTAKAAPPPPPKTAPPLPKVMSVRLITQGSAAPPGSVVDLGRYLSPKMADSAFRTTATRYPYLGQLKRVVVPLPPTYGQPRHYALQVGALSPRQARQLCDNLKKIGRPCVVR